MRNITKKYWICETKQTEKIINFDNDFSKEDNQLFFLVIIFPEIEKITSCFSFLNEIGRSFNNKLQSRLVSV